MKRLFNYLIFSAIFLFSISQLQPQADITPVLQEVISEKGEEEFISVNLQLAARYDDELLYRQSRTIEDNEKRRRIFFRQPF